MITSIFEKSKPINFIIVAVFVTLLFFISNYSIITFDSVGIFGSLFRLFVLLFSTFLLDFIVTKNNLNQKNSFAIMTFGLLFSLFPKALQNTDLLVANLFVLLAVRRLISLHKNKFISKKLFDAGFWIGIATLFYFWSLLFFALVIVALIYYAQNDIKRVIIPFIALLSVLVFLISYNIIFHDVYLTDSNFLRFASLDFTVYNSGAKILSLTVIASIFIWILFYYFKVINDKNNKLKPIYFLIAWCSVIAILNAIIAPLKDGSEFIFVFMPFSIIMANYLELISEKWFREVFVALLIITPVIMLFL